jgi:hypothetical protein
MVRALARVKPLWTSVHEGRSSYFGGKDVPFPTLFATIQALEQRVRVVAIVFAAGITVLMIHLALYPRPAVIPDLQDLHASYAQQHHAVKKHKEPQPGAP